MLKRLMNRARVRIRIEPIDPLLVKSGQATVGGTDMTFVRTYRSGRAEPYLPGSSLKGVLRSYCEKICRSLRLDPVPVCLPYVGPQTENLSSEQRAQISCGLSLTKWETDTRSNVASYDAFRVSCPACRIFGSLKFTGRCGVSDAYLVENPLLEKRDGVAIDRVTGGAASGAKYDLEVLTSGAFEADIEIRNFERWQLGLLSLALQDMKQGLISLGSGKSRGLGRFQAQITSFTLDYFHSTPEYLTGIFGMCSDLEREQYGFTTEQNEGELNAELPEPNRTGLRYEYDILEGWEHIMEAGVQDTVSYVQEVNWPGALNQFVNRRRG